MEEAQEIGKKTLLKRNIFITPRDRKIFLHLSCVRLLSTDQIARLVASGRENFKALVRRLRYLHCAGYVCRLPQQRIARIDEETGQYAGKNNLVYALGTAAAELLGEEGGQTLSLARTRWEKKNREIKNTQIEHALMIAGVYVVLKTGLGPGLVPNMKLHDWHQGQDLYHFIYTDPDGEYVPRPDPEDIKSKGLIRRPICPDAYLCLVATDTRSFLPCFLEADRGTMPVRRFLEKIENYLIWKRAKLHVPAFKFESFLVLTVTQTSQRRDSLRKAAEKICRAEPGMFRFATAEEYEKDPKNFVSHIWFLPGLGEKRFNLFQ